MQRVSLDQEAVAGRRAHRGPVGVPVAEAVAEGLATVRLEGLEPDADGLHVLDEVAAGRMSIDDALHRVLSAARAA